MRRKVELKEVMDDPVVTRETLAASLRFIRRVNRYLGGTRAVLGHIQRWARRGSWSGRKETVTLLDVAAGGADIPLAVLEWCRANHVKLRVTALDYSPIMLDLAQEYVAKKWRHAESPPIDFIQGDALALPFADRSFDYVTCSMFMHHLSDERAIAALREMLRVPRRGVIVNDLLRTHFAKVGIYLLTLAATPTDKNDARVSVAKAWTRRDVEKWRQATGADWLVYHHHVPARFTLAGERPER